MSWLKVMLCFFGLFIFGDMDVVWFVGFSILVIKCGLFGVFVVNLFVVLCVSLVVVILIFFDCVFML